MMVVVVVVISEALLTMVLPPLQDNYTALIWAAVNGHGDVLNTLIAYGANVNAKNKVLIDQSILCTQRVYDKQVNHRVCCADVL